MNDDERPDSSALDDYALDALVEAIKPYPLTAERQSLLRERLMARIKPPGQGTRTVRAEELNWTPVLPGVEIAVLRQDRQRNDQTAFWRMQPGAVLPAHQHAQEEEFIVIEGECRVGDHRLRAGDVHFAQAGSVHPEITSESGVLVLMRSEIYSPIAV